MKTIESVGGGTTIRVYEHPPMTGQQLFWLCVLMPFNFTAHIIGAICQSIKSGFVLGWMRMNRAEGAAGEYLERKKNGDLAKGEKERDCFGIYNVCFGRLQSDMVSQILWTGKAGLE